MITTDFSGHCLLRLVQTISKHINTHTNIDCQQQQPTFIDDFGVHVTARLSQHIAEDNSSTNPHYPPRINAPFDRMVQVLMFLTQTPLALSQAFTRLVIDSVISTVDLVAVSELPPVVQDNIATLCHVLHAYIAVTLTVGQAAHAGGTSLSQHDSLMDMIGNTHTRLVVVYAGAITN